MFLSLSLLFVFNTHTVEVWERDEMHTFEGDKQQQPFYLRGDDIDKNGAAALEEVLQYAENGFHRSDCADLSTVCSMYIGMKRRDVSVMCSSSSQLGVFPNDNLASLEMASSGAAVEEVLHKGGHAVPSGCGGAGAGVGDGRYEIYGYKGKDEAYLQHLENSHQRHTELDQVLGRAKQQVALGNFGHSIGVRGGGEFEADHVQWRDEHQRLIGALIASLNYNRSDKELNLLVEAVISHYGQLSQIKKAGARSDMFHILSGVWRTPVERCLMWLGGFRSSDLLKVVEKEIQPVSEEKLVGFCNLQQSCQQTEEALSQGMEALHHSLLLSLSHRSSSNAVVDYANQMATAMTSMEEIENFLNQADLLRLHTLQQLQRILTAHQAARALIAINRYESRLRALSSLWKNWANVKC